MNSYKNIKFEKMHHLGNDFVMIDFRGNADFFYNTFVKKYAKKMCDRHFGVGADGVIALLDSNDENFDFKMEIINSDGSFAMMCGNGLACLAAFIVKNGLNKKSEAACCKVTLNIDTRSGLRVPTVSLMNENVDFSDVNECRRYEVSIDMGMPELMPSNIPVNCDLLKKAAEHGNFGGNLNKAAESIEKVINFKYAFNDFKCDINLISMGNPHCVIITDKMPADDNFQKLGAFIETHPLFPEKTNVEFVEIVSNEEVNMKVWERGAGVTLACGTGACAVFYAAHLNKRVGEKALINLPGGPASAHLRNDGHIILNCRPEFVF